MLKLLYNENTLIGRLKKYFSVYFIGLSSPTQDNLFLFVLSIIALESADSIRFIYRHFISKISDKSLNAFYYACSYAKVDYTLFMTAIISTALRIIPSDLITTPIFLCIDDTMIEKYGKKFESVSKLFDHAAHNGSQYLNGHCFVSLMLCVPVWQDRKIIYKGIPVGYRMWKKDQSKLSLAAEMVRHSMKSLCSLKQVVLLADSWYGKSEIFKLSQDFDNLDVICNVRYDTVIYDLPPQRTGKRGRPATHGKRLSIDEDFTFTDKKYGGFFLGHRQVMTNLLKGVILNAFVTFPGEGASKRLFLSTVETTKMSMPCAWQEKSPLNECGSSKMDYIPLFWYAMRWNIEVSYYEHKTFWSLCNYMVRSSHGIEMMVNLICVAYSTVKIIPYIDKEFAEYQNVSPQEFRFILSRKIHEQVLLTGFVQSIETDKKLKLGFKSFKSWINAKLAAA